MYVWLFILEFNFLTREYSLCSFLSLSTVVLNSRDWSEIVWLPKNLCFKNQPCNSFIQKPAGMHWLSYNDAVSWLNEAKT